MWTQCWHFDTDILKKQGGKKIYQNFKSIVKKCVYIIYCICKISYCVLYMFQCTDANCTHFNLLVCSICCNVLVIEYFCSINNLKRSNIAVLVTNSPIYNSDNNCFVKVLCCDVLSFSHPYLLSLRSLLVIYFKMHGQDKLQNLLFNYAGKCVVSCFATLLQQEAIQACSTTQGCSTIELCLKSLQIVPHCQFCNCR